ncbi:hypothetical protein F511_43422 [Dorcoceras hygrometricum]|uniref:Uncharacterized protein n=1 Tax=Dorcoceras hygrometricum TaxID=472368 RepID=A0A2Z7D9F2_9LAMI|nr:hypothetical protein F511_43422 [Dorcoceras hygrometricum]
MTTIDLSSRDKCVYATDAMIHTETYTLRKAYTTASIITHAQSKAVKQAHIRTSSLLCYNYYYGVPSNTDLSPAKPNTDTNSGTVTQKPRIGSYKLNPSLSYPSNTTEGSKQSTRIETKKNRHRTGHGAAAHGGASSSSPCATPARWPRMARDHWPCPAHGGRSSIAACRAMSRRVALGSRPLAGRRSSSPAQSLRYGCAPLRACLCDDVARWPTRCCAAGSLVADDGRRCALLLVDARCALAARWARDVVRGRASRLARRRALSPRFSCGTAAAGRRSGEAPAMS